MSFWTLLGNTKINSPDVERVYRWLLQWPEAMAFPTRISKHEIARSSELDLDRVSQALDALISAGYIDVESGDRDDWMWVHLPRNPTDPAKIVVEPISPRKKPTPGAGRTVGLRLRWRVLTRDNNRCRGCGATVEDGARLDVDHIKPVSKGGLTIEENLQTLCYNCNMGKADIYLEIA